MLPHCSPIGAVIAIALGSPLSYILVLTAMVFTPVSLVAPAREVSILFAALMGAHLLREGERVVPIDRDNRPVQIRRP